MRTRSLDPSAQNLDFPPGQPPVRRLLRVRHIAYVPGHCQQRLQADSYALEGEQTRLKFYHSSILGFSQAG